jgi:hypothetical protein
MRLLAWHCKELRYSDISPSDRPAGIRSVVGPKIAATFSNVLAVFTCIEQPDTKKEISAGANGVSSILQTLGGRLQVVVVPFAHLSSNLATPPHAVELLEHFVSALEELGIETSRTSFGYHKDFELYFRGYGHPASVCYRAYPEEDGSASDASPMPGSAS